MFARDVRDGGIAILDANGLEGSLAFRGERLDNEPVDRCADEDLASDGRHCARGARVVHCQQLDICMSVREKLSLNSQRSQ